jgi:hypothetical protein
MTNVLSSFLDATNINTSSTSVGMLSLKQGKKFKKYQKKIARTTLDKDIERNSVKEGFSLTMNTNNVISNNNFSSQKDIIDNLRKEYQNTLQEYETLSNQISGSVSDYIERVNLNNPYLNKTIKFTTGQLGYVTNQGVVKYIPSTDILNSVTIPKKSIEVNLPWVPAYNKSGTPIPTNPPLISGTPMVYGQSVGGEGANVYVSELLPANTNAEYMNCYTVKDNMSFIGGSPNANDMSGNYTYNTCKQASIINGYRYFGLQNTNISTGKGYCAVSNSEQDVAKYGISTIPSKLKALWSSNTANQSGNSAILNGGGSLQIINSGGQPIFTTPIPESMKKDENPYIGCFSFKNNANTFIKNNKKKSTLPQIGKDYEYTSDQCTDNATQQGATYFGFGGPARGDQIKHCLVFDDLTSAQMKGTSKRCNNPYGGISSAAIYASDNSESDGNCYLILQDDGNMCIYNGTGPDDNQGLIWQTGTSNQQLNSNQNVVATKGKYGKNWIANGATLAAGDFLGSNDGKTALVMESDGNLVLYTYEMSLNCSKMSDGNIVGGVGASAINDIGVTTIKPNIGKLGFIDDNSILYTYPSSNQQYKNSYSEMEGVNALYYDIQGAAFGNATVESCKTACNNNEQCAGFVTNAAGNYCWPKNKGMFPFGGSGEVNADMNTYIRDKQPATVPVAISQNIRNIDTIQYQHYVGGGTINTNKDYGLKNVSIAQKQQLEHLQTKMNLLSNQISDLTTKFQNGLNVADQQSMSNVTEIDGYVTDITSTNNNIRTVSKSTTTNVQNILNDSDIVVLQKNYEYLFWSILATGATLVSMNVIKK